MIIGKRVLFEGRAVEVVGVAPAGIQFFRGQQLTQESCYPDRQTSFYRSGCDRVRWMAPSRTSTMPSLPDSGQVRHLRGGRRAPGRTGPPLRPTFCRPFYQPYGPDFGAPVFRAAANAGSADQPPLRSNLSDAAQARLGRRCNSSPAGSTDDGGSCSRIGCSATGTDDTRKRVRDQSLALASFGILAVASYVSIQRRAEIASG
jgi:hypothetical protein